MIKNAIISTGIDATARLDDAEFWVTVDAGGVFPNVSVVVAVDAPFAAITQQAPIPSTITSTTNIIAIKFAIISSGIQDLQTGNTSPVLPQFVLDE